MRLQIRGRQYLNERQRRKDSGGGRTHGVKEKRKSIMCTDYGEKEWKRL